MLARALHARRRVGEASAIVASCAAAGAIDGVSPTLVGMVTSRFLVYEQTIATGALWSVLLLGGVASLTARPTARRLLVLCAAAGFSASLRPTLAVDGVTTLALALAIAWKERLARRAVLAAITAFVAVSSLYVLGNTLRFGSLFQLRLRDLHLRHHGEPHDPVGSSVREGALEDGREGDVRHAVHDGADAIAAHELRPRVRATVRRRGAVAWRYYAPTFDLVGLAKVWTWRRSRSSSCASSVARAWRR